MKPEPPKEYPFCSRCKLASGQVDKQGLCHNCEVAAKREAEGR